MPIKNNDLTKTTITKSSKILPENYAILISRKDPQKTDVQDEKVRNEMIQLLRDATTEKETKKWLHERLKEREETYIAQCEHLVVSLLSCVRYNDPKCLKSLTCPNENGLKIIEILGHLSSNPEAPGGKIISLGSKQKNISGNSDKPNYLKVHNRLSQQTKEHKVNESITKNLSNDEEVVRNIWKAFNEKFNKNDKNETID